MNYYIGVTNQQWYEQLRNMQFNTINFWRPGSNNFKSLMPRDLFLFKLHSPNNYIVGAGYFVTFEKLPIRIAWEKYQTHNGTKNYAELLHTLANYRNISDEEMSHREVGCIILQNPIFFAKRDQIPAPNDWKPNIVQGKRYSTETIIGKNLYDAVQKRMNKN